MTWLVNWPPFEWIIILTIMANCVVMALDDKLSNNDKSIMSIKLVSWSSITGIELYMGYIITIVG